MTLDLIVSSKPLNPGTHCQAEIFLRKYPRHQASTKINAKLAEMLLHRRALSTDIWSTSSAQETLISLIAH